MAEVDELAGRLDVGTITFMPISALTGANVVERSNELGWYHGPTLLHFLETVVHASEPAPATIDVRGSPCSTSCARTAPSTATTAATPARSPPGRLREGDEVVVLPSGARTRVAGIDTFDGPVHEAVAGRGRHGAADRRRRHLAR